MVLTEEILSGPTLKNLTAKDYGKPPEKQNEILKTLGTPHISSFDFMIEKGLDFAIKDISPIEFELSGKLMKIKYLSAVILDPKVPVGLVAHCGQNFYPTEARQRKCAYTASLKVTVAWSYGGTAYHTFEREVGRIPIMLKSKRCNLRNLSPTQLIEKGEHADQWGGYFIVGGHEKLIRMLILNRRNYPIAIKRSGWKARGLMFSDIGVYIRSVKKDESSTNNVLHFVTNGSARFMFSHNRSMFFAPVILLFKCLVDKSDEYIFKHLMRGNKSDQYFKVCLLGMLQSLHEERIHTQSDAKHFVGQIFKDKLYDLKHLSVEEVCDHILTHSVLPHLDNYIDKFLCLSHMTRKLFDVVQGQSKLDTEDSIMLQEVLTGGSLYLQVLKDKLIGMLNSTKLNLLKKEKPQGPIIKETDVIGAFKGNIENAMNNFLATGNVPSGKYSTLNLMQSSGFVIIAENINRMRYMSHFRSVHRGSYFEEMRSSEPRQLRTDAWGFICPVHTPDGTPCGLLNHLTKNCQISQYEPEELVSNIPLVLISLGMLPTTPLIQSVPEDALTVMLDGKIIGYIIEEIAVNLVPKLRILKIGGVKVPKSLEIVFLKKSKKGIGLYPGLYLFTAPGRMLRPVINLAAGEVELIGTFEQVYMDICITLKEAYPGITTHKELSKTDFLSNLANLIPMPDCNQSPRNMYQCQMGKQTMGTPCLNWKHQGEEKLYRLQTPATPFFRPVHYDNLDMDNFPMGTNAIVAVISYTGYDMEDAMIINKSSYDRGFAHGCIFKAMFVELENSKDYFTRDPANKKLEDTLGPDGLVYVGAKLKERDPLYCFWKETENRYVVRTYSGKEEITVEVVRMSSGFTSAGHVTPNCAYIGYRIQRNPTVGDKFASRAGQKGICSVKWPAEDLPFTDSGMVPDIVFNPHGFPSRMTIAMMIECMAGKSAAVHGLVHDATPFIFTEDNTAIDYFGKLLQAGGYNYHGTESMYSGIDGSMMQAQIFFGIVHYQRLRHMVSDKWQVRSKGPVDRLTHQPVKGRKRGGGVRFGEMERDGVLAHGASWVLLDRLFNSSDKSKELVCRSCGSLLGPTVIIETINLVKNKFSDDKPVICKQCGEQDNIGCINIPYVLRNLVCQLASFNIKIQLDLKENDSIVSV